MNVLPESEPPQRHSEPPAAPKLQKRAAKAKKTDDAKTAGRITWGRLIVWGVIALLGLAAVVEFRAQSAYRKALGTCETALERSRGESRPITFDELKGNLPPDPVHTQEMRFAAQSDVYTWTWQGVRRYKVHLFVNPKDGAAWNVTSEP
jgi:hypothetical protein